MLAEANVENAELVKYFGDSGGTNDRLPMLFDFLLSVNCLLALARGKAAPIARALKSQPAIPNHAQWATFLRNHDEVDLSRLTPKEQAECFAAFGPDPDMQLYDRGIRRRLAPMLDGDQARLRLAYSLQFTLPGTPVLRYGEELGMGDDLRCRSGRRSAPRCSGRRQPQAGSPRPSPRLAVRPMPTRGRFSNRNINVRQQRTDPSSLLRWFGQLINEVRECPEISVGTITVLDLPLPRSVIVHRYDAPEGSILLMHNLADRAVTIDLSAVEGTKAAYTVFGDADYGPLPRSLKQLRVNGWGYRWLRLRRGA